MEYSSEMLKIVEGALKSDKVKVLNYTKLLIEKLKQDHDTRLVNSFSKLLTNSASFMSQMSPMDLMKVPIDQESRLPMADVQQPSQVNDCKVILNNDALYQIDKFLEYHRNISKLVDSGIVIPNSILLYGPPGCGKNKLASYLCASTGLPLVTARLDGMISAYLGSTAKNIRAIFEYAHSVPCILFLDEFDALAKVRDDNNELGELKRVVNSLLQNIDHLTNGSIIVAATNHDHLLDPAVWRRFGFKIPIDKPDFKSRIELIDLFLSANKFNEKDKQIIASLLDGFSGSDIESICNKVKIDSILNGSTITLISLFEKVFEYLRTRKTLNDTNVSLKSSHRIRAKYLRDLDEKLFSYSQIASILDVSKSYVAGLFSSEGE